MMVLRNYCSKAEHRGCYGLLDIRMMMTRNYYSKVDDDVSCGYRRMFA
jgi:hypothetical protein